MSARRSGSMWWLRVVSVLPCPMSVPSPMVMPPVSWKRQPRLMKTSLPRVRFLPNSLWNGGKTVTDSSIVLAGELCQQGADLVGRAVAVVDLGDDPQGFLCGVVHEPVLLGAAFDRCAAVHVVEEVVQLRRGDSRHRASTVAVTGPSSARSAVRRRRPAGRGRRCRGSRTGRRSRGRGRCRGRSSPGLPRRGPRRRVGRPGTAVTGAGRSSRPRRGRSSRPSGAAARPGRALRRCRQGGGEALARRW